MISAAISHERLDHLASTGQAHLRPIYAAMRMAGVSLFLVPQGQERFLAPRVRSFVGLVADDTDCAVGPNGFHRKSLRRLAQDAKCIALISSDIMPAVYATAAQIAALGRNVLIVETRCEQESAWLDFLKASAPRAHLLICTAAAGSA